MALFDRKSERTVFPFTSLRVLPYQTYSGALNMALDYSLARSASQNDPPVLRFYGWQPYCLSLGYHQDQTLVDFEQVQAKGYDVVRRPTGGSAIFHSEELTYALILPRADINHHDIYRFFHLLLARALNTLGYDVELNYEDDDENYLKQGRKRFACFNRPAFAEIKFKGKKVVGSAQKLYQNALLQHGSVLIGPKQNEIVQFLKLDHEAKEKYKKNLRESSVALREIHKKNISPNQIADALLSQFKTSLPLNIYYEDLTDFDLGHAQKFVDRFKIQ